MQAKLPEDKKKKTIADMKVGEVGYCVPWAVKVDLGSKVWVDTEYTFYKKEGGTADTRIVKVEGGYEVEVPSSEDYSPMRLANVALAPVVKLTWV